MTKTNGKYTYEDLLLRKRVLKQEIRDIEEIATFQDTPRTLGVIGGSLKDKAMGFIQSPSALNLLIETGLGFGSGKLISKFVNKKSMVGKTVIMASSYLIPFAINKTKKLITRITSHQTKKNV